MPGRRCPSPTSTRSALKRLRLAETTSGRPPASISGAQATSPAGLRCHPDGATSSTQGWPACGPRPFAIELYNSPLGGSAMASASATRSSGVSSEAACSSSASVSRRVQTASRRSRGSSAAPRKTASRDQGSTQLPHRVSDTAPRCGPGPSKPGATMTVTPYSLGRHRGCA